MRRAALAGLHAALAAAVLVLSTAPIPAVGRFGPPLVIGCAPGGSTPDADAAIGADGTVLGFANPLASCPAGLPGPAPPIGFFVVSPAGQVSLTPSPYAGRVIQVADDGTGGTYVLFARGGALCLGAHLATGTFAAPTTLTRTGAAGGSFHATLAASAGRWWAVWAERAASTGAAASTAGARPPSRLFQARTLLGDQGRTQITSPPAGGADDEPAIAYRAGRATLVWTRASRLGAADSTSVLRLGTSTGRGWRSRTPTGAGTHDHHPSIAVQGGITYLAWNRDTGTYRHAIEFASNPGGKDEFTSVSVYTFGNLWPADATTIAVSGNDVFLAWSQLRFSWSLIAQRHDGVWTTDSGDVATQALRVLAHDGLGSVLYDDSYAGTLSIKREN